MNYPEKIFDSSGGTVYMQSAITLINFVFFHEEKMD